MSREAHVRFWERVGVRFPRATRLPLYRQAQGLARQGIEIGREVLAGWLGAAAFEVRPVVARLREILLGSARLFADETTMPVLDPGRGKTKTGFAWAIARDDRPWGGTEPPAVGFHYAPGRGSEHARELLRSEERRVGKEGRPRWVPHH